MTLMFAVGAKSQKSNAWEELFLQPNMKITLLLLVESTGVWIRCHIIISHRNTDSRGVIVVLLMIS